MSGRLFSCYTRSKALLGSRSSDRHQSSAVPVEVWINKPVQLTRKNALTTSAWTGWGLLIVGWRWPENVNLLSFLVP
jgi:hypothetical protein